MKQLWKERDGSAVSFFLFLHNRSIFPLLADDFFHLLW
ncbi:hypothetical protein BCH308197_3957 [Bacillus cereus H3081.97]|nr:hypothetical protein BCH308197_3957 [Bacillus cereus H3081.97]KLA06551.1 hypothetical protein B4153_4181 [Bacillus cereus]KLA06708.1 hypothetical protein B4086_3873 [Bacillus cereus]KYQ01340.1 hypothetical protein B4079_3481 [Bacillus cereus]KZD57378.1 hypothetical protein B4085_0378 [Bacillus cereus]